MKDTVRNPSDAVAERVNRHIRHVLSEPLDAALYLTATPIGNLADISLRALSVLARASVIAAEDTRHSRKLLRHYGIERELISYHDHNGDIAGPKIAARITQGQSVALISDAGTPLISDPGYKLARLVRAAGGDVHVIPGPSSVTAGLSLSGLPTDRFYFEGFLPPKSGARQKRIAALASIDASLILFESAKRVGALLEDLSTLMGTREASLLREMTKLNEEILSGTVDELKDELKERALKGEVVLIIGPKVADAITDEQIVDALAKLMKSGASVRDSVKQVVHELGGAKSHVYELALTLKSAEGDQQ